MMKICEECNQDFNASRSTKRFCGTQCAKDFRKNNSAPIVKSICKECYEEFEIGPGAKGLYCSRSCAAKENNKNRVRVLKKDCKNFECNVRIKSSETYCSEKCKIKNSYKINFKKEKYCYRCNKVKSKNLFHVSKTTKDGIQSRCKECNIEVAIEWQNKNKNKYEDYSSMRSKDKDVQFYKRAKKYGLTVDELEILLDQANGLCEICKNPPLRWLVVDHCHNTEIVRGILCEQCNQALGLFKDNIEAMKSAIKYLEKNKI